MHTFVGMQLFKSYAFAVALNILILLISCVEQTTSSKALKDIEIKEGEPIPTIDLGDTPYVMFRKSLSWMDARRECETTVGRLAVFENEDAGLDAIYEIETLSIPYTESYDRGEYEFELGMDRRYWFGLADIGLEGDWRWMDDGRQLAFNTLWYPNQPDHVKDHKLEHCGALWNPIYYLRETHSWNDEPCENKLYFICEYYPHSKSKIKRQRKPAAQNREKETETTTLKPAPEVFTTDNNNLPDPPVTVIGPQTPVHTTAAEELFPPPLPNSNEETITQQTNEEIKMPQPTTAESIAFTTPLPVDSNPTTTTAMPFILQEGIYVTPTPCHADTNCMDVKKIEFTV